MIKYKIEISKIILSAQEQSFVGFVHHLQVNKLAHLPIIVVIILHTVNLVEFQNIIA